MNTTIKAIPTLVIAAFLSFVLITGTPFNAAFASGELDDEEEEQKLTELESEISALKESIGIIELNLTEGVNHIDATCPVTEEIVEEVKEVINNTTAPVEEACPFVEEEEPAPEPEPEPQPVAPICNIPEEEPAKEENKTEQLIPIVCPINGEIIAYDNATTPEKEFLPPSAIVEEEPEPAPQPVEEPAPPATTTDNEIVPNVEAIPEESINPCTCIVVDESTKPLLEQP